MKYINLLLKKIKKIVWLAAVFIVRIIFAPNHFKVPIFKGLYYNLFYGFTKDQIALYDINKDNKNEYLSEFDWYKSRFINEPYNFVLNNKLVCVDLIKNYIKTPETYIIKKDNTFYSYDDKKYDIEKVMSLIKEKKSAYFKPISVGKGIGVFRIDYKNNKFLIDYKETEEKHLKSILINKNNYFLSSCITQAKYLNNIYDKTSNTIRLITVRDKKTNTIKVLHAVQRIGVKETIPVDNGSRGGLISEIDLKTGKLSIAKSLHNKKTYKNHPDSNNPIEGVTVPNFDKIKKQVISVMEKLPYLYFIAWDLLVTDKDVYVLEANSSSGVNIIQVFGGVRNKELGAFYKEHNIIK